MTTWRIPAFAAALVLLAAVPGGAQESTRVNAPYVPTPQHIVDRMLKLAQPKAGDVLYDLGSGDGRIPITAVRDYGVRRGVGIDLNPQRIAESNANAREAGVQDRVEFIQGNIFEVDFSAADVVTMYLLPDLNIELRPQLLSELRPGTRIVSHRFHLGDWVPDDHVIAADPGRPSSSAMDEEALTLHLWIVPARVGGVWEWKSEYDDFRLDIKQVYQRFGGGLYGLGQAMKVEDGVMAGDRMGFVTTAQREGREVVVRFDGTVYGNVIRGSLAVDGVAKPIVARRAQ